MPQTMAAEIKVNRTSKNRQKSSEFYNPDSQGAQPGQKVSSMGRGNVYDMSSSPQRPAYDTRDEETNQN